MTVAELIEKLREMPQDALVATASGYVEGEELATNVDIGLRIIERGGGISYGATPGEGVMVVSIC